MLANSLNINWFLNFQNQEGKHHTTQLTNKRKQQHRQLQHKNNPFFFHIFGYFRGQEPGQSPVRCWHPGLRDRRPQGPGQDRGQDCLGGAGVHRRTEGVLDGAGRGEGLHNSNNNNNSINSGGDGGGGGLQEEEGEESVDRQIQENKETFEGEWKVNRGVSK